MLDFLADQNFKEKATCAYLAWEGIKKPCMFSYVKKI